MRPDGHPMDGPGLRIEGYVLVLGLFGGFSPYFLYFLTENGRLALYK